MKQTEAQVCSELGRLRAVNAELLSACVAALAAEMSVTMEQERELRLGLAEQLRDAIAKARSA